MTNLNVPKTPEAPQKTIIYKDSLLNTLDDKNLTFNDKIAKLKEYLQKKLNNLGNFNLYCDFDFRQELTFIKKANEYIEAYLYQDNLDDIQKRNLIYLVSICSCYRDLVVKTLTELTEIELDKKRPYKIGELEIGSFEELNSNREYIKDILNKYEEIEINSFSRAIRYAEEESYNKSKAPEESETCLFFGRKTLHETEKTKGVDNTPKRQ